MDTLKINQQPASPTGPVKRATAPVMPQPAIPPAVADATATLGIDRRVCAQPTSPFEADGEPAAESLHCRIVRLNQNVQSVDARYKTVVDQLEHRDHNPAPPDILRTPYTGGTPALPPEQMDEVLIKNNLILRGLYALPERFSFMVRGYGRLTTFLGPVGAAAFFGLNVKNSITYMKDPHTPAVIKGSMVTATALSGVTAALAARMTLHLVHAMPLAGGNAALKSLGSLAGKAGLGAGVLLSAIDTYQTFHDPHSTAGEKGFSLLGTGSAVGLLGLMAIGSTGPLGLVLGLTCLAAPFLKGWLGKNKTVNAVCGAVGHALGSIGSGLKHLLGG